MTSTEFKAIVEANGGEDKVIAITFDNSAGLTFTRAHNPYTHAEYLMEDINCLRMVGMDIRKNHYYVVKHLDNIQAIHFASERNVRTDYESQSAGW